MYNDTEAKKMEEIASRAMDSVQSKIDELNSLGGNARSRSSEQLLNWQSWLGNISFTLAAIGGAVVVGKNLPSPYILASLILFLINGLWISLTHKKFFEASAVSASKEVDEYRPLYDDKKKAAFQLWEDPHNIDKHLAFLGWELKIMQKTKVLEKEQLAALENERISYHNDFWLGILVSAIYFLLEPVAAKVYENLALTGSGFPYVFWLGWLLIILIIINGAFESRPRIKESSNSKILKVKSELKHTKEYTDKVQQTIEEVRQRQSANQR